MERVSRFLEKQAEPVSRRTIETNVTGKTDYVRQAIDCLVREEFAAETDGPYKPLRSLNPFRENNTAHDGSPQFAPDAPNSPPSPEGGRGGTPEPAAAAQASGATDPPGSGATNSDVPAAGEVRSEGAPCRFPTHRDSDWVTADGRVVCGICHPPATDVC